MSEQDDGGLDRPVVSSEAVESALVTTHEIITSPVYTHKFPDGYVNENYPIREGGWWGQLMYSLEGRWENIKNRHRRETNTFDKDEADGQTQLVTDGGRNQSGDETLHAAGPLATPALLAPGRQRAPDDRPRAAWRDYDAAGDAVELSEVGTDGAWIRIEQPRTVWW